MRRSLLTLMVGTALLLSPLVGAHGHDTGHGTSRDALCQLSAGLVPIGQAEQRQGSSGDSLGLVLVEMDLPLPVFLAGLEVLAAIGRGESERDVLRACRAGDGPWTLWR